jgi:hypothetical protein
MLSSRVGRRWIFRTNSGWLGGHRHEDLLALVVCGALVLGGMPMALGGLWDASHVAQSYFWPTTSGRVLSVRMDSAGGIAAARWQPRVTYTYSLGGRTYVSTQLSLSGPPEVDGQAAADEYLARYVPNTYVTVHYNAHRPEESVTQHTLGARDARALAFGLSSCLIGVALLLMFDLMRR